jgi:thiamine pyrophosphate-dependent acetolactate synthase large subunit-like protein
MKLEEALAILAPHRGRRVVVATMSAAGVWPRLSDTALDFTYIPSAMGQGPDLGLGLALAQPDRGAIVLNGDGCMLMNLGCLVTMAQHPANLFLVIVDNGLYEVTGGQPHAGAGHTDFAGFALAAGIQRVYTFETADAWRAGVAEALTDPGPVVIRLKAEGRVGQKTPLAPHPMAEQVSRLREALRQDTSAPACRVMRPRP